MPAQAGIQKPRPAVSHPVVPRLDRGIQNNQAVFASPVFFIGRGNPGIKPGLLRRYAPRKDELFWMPAYAGMTLLGFTGLFSPPAINSSQF